MRLAAIERFSSPRGLVIMSRAATAVYSLMSSLDPLSLYIYVLLLLNVAAPADRSISRRKERRKSIRHFYFFFVELFAFLCVLFPEYIKIEKGVPRRAEIQFHVGSAPSTPVEARGVDREREKKRVCFDILNEKEL